MENIIDKIKNIDKRNWIIILVVLIVGIFIGQMLSGKKEESSENIIASVDSETIWTCSMHPQIRQDHPGTCPLCGMDLTPLEDEEESDLPVEALRMSPTAMQLANIHTMSVQTGDIEKDIRLAGKINLDPRYTFSQNAHIPGRVEELYVNTLGEYVKAGQQIAVIYSPELINAQKELLQAYQNKDNYPGMYEAVREKLLLWKIQPQQIDNMITKGVVVENMPIFANHNGYMVEKLIDKGDYLQAGSPIFKLAQLNNLWGEFDIYEKDASFVKRGMNILYDLPSMPGKEFKATIDFIEPILNPETRTLKARILIKNPNLDFKPEMLINGLVQSKLALGTNKIVVPKTAVMWTGKHSVVYIKHATEKNVGFEMRPVVLGASLDESYVIEEGLEVGEEIVVEGTFSVDAAAQLANKPSMMNHVHPATQRLNMPKLSLTLDQQSIFSPIMERYFKIKDALVNDDFANAKKEYLSLTGLWNKDNLMKLPHEAHNALSKASEKNALKTSEITKSNNIDQLRTNFHELSNVFIELVEAIGPLGQNMYLQHCPMANNDQGADWLSKEDQVLNPYYGASMLKCGEVKKTIK
ncbi:efflux RND transporter periplasmic adaptor subunit [Sphingobacterium sp. UT-1RO-CII-1]|uniref:efflux RND transporter periplasmic adaptor subunit n=1 Tax=Sphingobacterium sp. UT-1RO-CII-1 TaxID=2995225 RepID=UPI00227BC899|nr:efflux RND transporter periplasmic adaptor subunit [Sphingobacterium sp. UT-1RO-CII-1]MCY4781509.1 efflux RND transporter periplasmic adaptor subunit [Sphingobacterium sp. UT-1RO-CII-1]